MTTIANFRNVVDPALSAEYRAPGWWGDGTLADLVFEHARNRPEVLAFATENHHVTWAQYEQTALRLAAAILTTDLEPGEPVAVLMHDGPTPHIVYVANELSGVITIGVGARAGKAEILHFFRKTAVCALISHAQHRDFDIRELFTELQNEGVPLRHHILVPDFAQDNDGEIIVDGRVSDADPSQAASAIAERRMRSDDFFMINSTSGTTGLPKCVMHTLNSKLYMAKQGREVGELKEGEVVFGGAPIPFGFGLFTTHFLPALLGGTCVTTSRFSPEMTLELIEHERVTVLVCVSTQFKMLLNSPDMPKRDLTSLKVMFTGGEMIPYGAARDFEERTGACVLNFYGSNESGMATGTRVSDSPEHRLRTGGSHLEGTDVRLFDDGVDVTDTGRGQPGARGPGNCLGYYDDPPANLQLFADGGYVLHADICEIDADGFLRVVGRISDIIIRGGKNISAAIVEEEVSAHPSVGLAAAIPVPDTLFGERVGVYVELRPDTELSLEELSEFLLTRNISKELIPEYLFVVDEIPRSTGSKVAKAVFARTRSGGLQVAMSPAKRSRKDLKEVAEFFVAS